MTTIRVEARHVDGACRKSAFACPIANAIREVVRDDVKVVVGITDVGLDEGACSIGLPDEAQRFVAAWDLGSLYQAATFDLPIPARYLRAQQ